MKQFSIAIVSDDLDYAEALSRGLKHRSKAFLISIYTPGGFTEKWKNEGLAFRKGFGIILWDGSDGERIRGDNIIWVTERRADADESKNRTGRGNTIFRYNLASVIHGQILDVYEACRRSEEKGSGNEKTGSEGGVSADPKARVIAFGSWHGAAGCTTLCHAFAQELTRFFKKRVFWMSMDGIDLQPASMAAGGETKTRGVDHFLYRTLGEEKGSVGGLEGFMIDDGYGVMSLAPSRGRNPLPYLRTEEMSRVLGAILDEGMFDAVLIDAGTCCSESAGWLLGSAETVCIVERRNEDERKARYMNWIGNALEEKTPGERSICLKNGISASEEDRGVFCLAEKTEDSEGMLLDGEFGKNIHALAESLWYNEIEM